MKLIFMGTPAFAVPSLEAILAAGHEVTAVYTQPDRPSGRKMTVTPSPVKACATRYGIPVYQPETFRGGAQTPVLQSMAPDAIVVVAYGRLLPGAVLDIPRFGCINVHGSVLPRYRGAAPIQWAVARGERETGVTTMYMAPELDAGDIIYTEKTPIGDNDTAGDIHDRLMHVGADLLVRTLAYVESGLAPRIQQDASQATFAPMLRKEDARIDWAAPADAVCALVRGMYPWPVAYSDASGEMLKVYRVQTTGRRAAGEPGQVLTTAQGDIEVICGDGLTVKLLEVQGQGGRHMTAVDYARGHAIEL